MTHAEQAQAEHERGVVVDAQYLRVYYGAGCDELNGRWVFQDGSTGMFSNRETVTITKMVRDVPDYNRRVQEWIGRGAPEASEPTVNRMVEVIVPKFVVAAKPLEFSSLPGAAAPSVSKPRTAVDATTGTTERAVPDLRGKAVGQDLNGMQGSAEPEPKKEVSGRKTVTMRPERE